MQTWADIRLHIYQQMVASSAAPTPAETARSLDLPVCEVEEAYRGLADDHVVVLHPGSTNIWMAMPFSNVPTPYTVVCGGRAYYANCAWDAFGVVATLHSDARILTQCPDCREPLQYGVRDNKLTRVDGVVHFALPVREWWKDIGFT